MIKSLSNLVSSLCPRSCELSFFRVSSESPLISRLSSGCFSSSLWASKLLRSRFMARARWYWKSRAYCFVSTRLSIRTRFVYTLTKLRTSNGFSNRTIAYSRSLICLSFLQKRPQYIKLLKNESFLAMLILLVSLEMLKISAYVNFSIGSSLRSFWCKPFYGW